MWVLRRVTVHAGFTSDGDKTGNNALPPNIMMMVTTTSVNLHELKGNLVYNLPRSKTTFIVNIHRYFPNISAYPSGQVNWKINLSNNKSYWLQMSELDGTQTGVQSPQQYRLDHIFLTLSKIPNSVQICYFRIFRGGGYFGNLTFNTESKSAIFEFSGGGGGVLWKPNFQHWVQICYFWIFGGGGGGGTLESTLELMYSWYFGDFEPKNVQLEMCVAPQIVSPPIGGGD